MIEGYPGWFDYGQTFANRRKLGNAGRIFLVCSQEFFTILFAFTWHNTEHKNMY